VNYEAVLFQVVFPMSVRGHTFGDPGHVITFLCTNFFS